MHFINVLSLVLIESSLLCWFPVQLIMTESPQPEVSENAFQPITTETPQSEVTETNEGFGGQCDTQIAAMLQELHQDLVDLSEKVDRLLPKTCPDGFVLQPGTNHCFRVVLEGLNWNASRSLCSDLNSGSYLAVIDDAAMSDFVVGQLTSIPDSDNLPCRPSFDTSGKYIFYYTSGQRKIIGNCQSTFVWKPTTTAQTPVDYTNWGSGQPDCNTNNGNQPGESCINYDSDFAYKWNDVSCSNIGCPICRVDV